MSSIDVLPFVFLATGFAVGFGHCLGMCGPIVVSLALQLKGAGSLKPHLLYHAGRLTTYAVLGGVMGISGSFTAVSSRIAGIQQGVMIAAGVLIVGMGFAMSGWLPAGNLFRGGTRFQAAVSRGYRKLSASRSLAAYFPLGLLLGLLPCGPVYTALLAAARSGMEAPGAGHGFAEGMILMLAFGLGTVPALLLAAKLVGFGWIKSRERIYRAGAAIMVAVGLYFVVQGIRY